MVSRTALPLGHQVPAYLMERQAIEPNRTPIAQLGTVIENNRTHNYQLLEHNRAHTFHYRTVDKAIELNVINGQQLNLMKYLNTEQNRFLFLLDWFECSIIELTEN